MSAFEDYYEILQVHYLAEPEIIGAAYKKLANKYHPDHNPSPAAAEKMKKINIAHDILSDPEKRKKYDSEWFKRKDHIQNSNVASTSSKSKPVLEVTPRHIRFKDLEYRSIKTTYFDVKNIGGPYTNYIIVKEHLPKWLEITEVKRLTNEALPARVTIKVTGQYAESKYESYIPIKIENKDSKYSEEVKVHIELVMKGPILQIDRKNIEFNVIPGIMPPPQIMTLKNAGVGAIEGNLIPDEQWIKISPRSVRFTNKQDIQVQIDASKLANNSGAHIDIRTNGGSESITIRAIFNYQKTRTTRRTGVDNTAARSTLNYCPKCKTNAIWFNYHSNIYECLKCRRTWRTLDDIK
jgi:curved DNA-binding protein CbpA